MTKRLPGEDLLGYLLSVPIVVAILSLIGQVFLDVAGVFDTAGSAQLPTAFLLFSSAALPLYQLLPTGDGSLIQGVVAAVNVVLALVFIFCSSYSIKGSRLFFHAVTILYALDTLVTVVLLALDAGARFLFAMGTANVVLTILLHVLFLGLLVYGSLLLRQKGKQDDSAQPK